MKIDIYGLLGMIKEGKAPKLILFRSRQWSYDKKEKDYVNIFNEWLFDSHIITDILNDEVEILETTITYKQDDIEKAQIVVEETLDKLSPIIEAIQKEEKQDDYIQYQPYTGKLNIPKPTPYGPVFKKKAKQNDKIEPLEYEEIKMCNGDIVYNKIISFDNEKLVLKINELIDKVNKL